MFVIYISDIILQTKTVLIFPITKTSLHSQSHHLYLPSKLILPITDLLYAFCFPNIFYTIHFFNNYPIYFKLGSFNNWCIVLFFFFFRKNCSILIWEILKNKIACITCNLSFPSIRFILSQIQCKISNTNSTCNVCNWIQ